MDIGKEIEIIEVVPDAAPVPENVPAEPQMVPAVPA